MVTIAMAGFGSVRNYSDSPAYTDVNQVFNRIKAVSNDEIVSKVRAEMNLINPSFKLNSSDTLAPCAGEGCVCVRC